MFQNLILKRPLAILDTETTGLDTKTDRIIEISVLKLSHVGLTEHRSRRLNPGILIPKEVTDIHKISDADVAGMPIFRNIAFGLVDFLSECDLCGFNLKHYDLPLLCAEFERVGVNFTLDGRAIIDPMEIFHHYEGGNLAHAVRFYLSRDHGDAQAAHSAKADVLATAEILDAMLARYADLPRGVAELHERFKSVDAAGKFSSVGGEVRFAFSDYRGQALDAVARSHPGFLQWILRKDFPEDTKEVIRGAQRHAAESAVARS
jgi:DNA polymerase-3 subunit epsilon